jgi:hypothetical protein
MSKRPNRWVDRIKRPAAVFLLSLVCVMAASGPKSHAKRSISNPRSEPVVIPAGTPIHVSMIDQLNTGENKAGDMFRGSLARPIVVGGRTIAPKDALVQGTLSEVISSGRLKRPASLTMRLTQLTLSNGRTVPLETSPYTLDGKSHAMRNAALIGGGAGAGAVLGGVAGGKKGALIGSAVGAGAGTATAYLTGKQEIVVPAETSLQFTAMGSPASGGGPDLRSSERSNSAIAENRKGSDSWGDLIFTERDCRIIRDYFRGRHSNLPPGLAKRGGNLPPGLEKQLQRNGKLPPGLQKRVEPFPQDLVLRLPRISERIRRVILGRRALMLDEQDNILDVIEAIVD